MPVPSRPLPRVGARARIAHFGGGFERARVVAVEDEGRLLEVLSEHGERLQFALSRANARFVAAGGGGAGGAIGAPRLELLGDSDGEWRQSG